MALITLLDVRLAFGDQPLLDHVTFSLAAGERVGLIGRNGSGKSSLLQILAGLKPPDDGQRVTRDGLRLAHVAQEPVLDDDATVADAVAEGLADVRAWIDAWGAGGADAAALQARIEARDGWNWPARVAQAMRQFQLNPDERIAGLSGGTRKRVALARAMVAEPDVLLLDEPTNHLDLDAIDGLADMLAGFAGAVVFITHDRAFLDAVATRIVELDRGRLRDYPGRFAAWQRIKEEQLAQEAALAARADRLLAQEEAWIRQGVEARRTRAAARIARLEQLRARRAARREAVGRVRMELARGEISGRLVAELTDVHKAFDGQVIVRDLSLTVLRGDKIALVGPNGAGKTTLLKLIVGELAPDAGSVRRGTRLQVTYFDQMRNALDPDATLADSISPGSEWIEIGGRRQHVRGYLADFLFSPARTSAPVRTLSGGERNRLLLARLFARPANLLVLDEPTNDLDIDTLELLEALLADYEGTVLLVSHDRRFVDQVATGLLVAEGDGRWREYEGGISDWLTQSRRASALAAGPAAAPAASAAESGLQTASSGPAPLQKKKRSYRDHRELEALPGRIAALEAEQAAIAAELADGSLYARDHRRAAQLASRSACIEDELMALLERWQALEASG